MNYFSKILLTLFSISFIAPLISLLTFVSQLFHMYLTPYLIGTEPPIPTEFLFLFLQLLLVLIVIHGILIFLIYYNYYYKATSTKILNKTRRRIVLSKYILLSFLLSVSYNLIFYLVIFVPVLIFLNIVLILVSLENNLNMLNSIFILFGNLILYIMLILSLIFLFNFSTKKLHFSTENFNKSSKNSYLKVFTLKSEFLFLFVFILIDTIIFSIIYIFVQLHFYLEIKYLFGILSILLFFTLIYRDLNKFVTNFNEKQK